MRARACVVVRSKRIVKRTRGAHTKREGKNEDGVLPNSHASFTRCAIACKPMSDRACVRRRGWRVVLEQEGKPGSTAARHTARRLLNTNTTAVAGVQPGEQ